MAHTAQPLEQQLERLAELALAHPEHRHFFDCLLPAHLRNQRALEAFDKVLGGRFDDDLIHAFALCKCASDEWVERIRERGSLLLLGAVR